MRLCALALVAACGRVGFDPLEGTTAGSTLALDRVTPAMPLGDFPLLVVLDDTRAARDLMQPDASDLRFSASDGTPLPYELEQVGAPGGAPLVAWVRVPTIVGTGVTIRVHYGDPTAPVATGPVWSNAYEAVWHMTGTGTLVDSTAHHRDGVAHGTTSTTGAVAAAREFAATQSNWIGVSDGAIATGALTMSGWIYLRDPNPPTMFYSVVSRQWIDSGWNDFYLGWMQGAVYVTFSSDTTPAEWSGPTLPTTQWHHIAATYDGATATGYLDGMPFTAGPLAGPLGATTSEIYLGADRNNVQSTTPVDVADADFLDGMLDEVRIESVARPASWLSYDDASMRDQVITYGPIERLY